jgi:hypothetical protein
MKKFPYFTIISIFFCFTANASTVSSPINTNMPRRLDAVNNSSNEYTMSIEWQESEPAQGNAIDDYKKIIETLKQNGTESLQIQCPKSDTLALIKALSLKKAHGTSNLGTLELLDEKKDYHVLYIKLNV